MAILDEVKTALRMTTTDAGLTAEVTRLIDEAVLDLTKTADIKSIDLANLDALEKGAIITYVKWKWYGDDRYRDAYFLYKDNMSISYKYRDTSYPIPL